MSKSSLQLTSMRNPSCWPSFFNHTFLFTFAIWFNIHTLVCLKSKYLKLGCVFVTNHFHTRCRDLIVVAWKEAIRTFLVSAGLIWIIPLHTQLCIYKLITIYTRIVFLYIFWYTHIHSLYLQHHSIPPHILPTTVLKNMTDEPLSHAKEQTFLLSSEFLLFKRDSYSVFLRILA